MSSILKRSSKFLSLVLRHQPEKIGLQLSSDGWAEVDPLLDKMQQAGLEINLELLQKVVSENDKQRFTFNENQTRIRANQGHSISVDLQLAPALPPDLLFHGTADRFWSSIQVEGLTKRSRQHVHLSADRETASKVGRRHGKLLLLLIDAVAMHQQGHLFYQSKNGVWLTRAVPPQFLSIDHSL
ncbi:MAG: RNA 2'-phosphotransferase [Salibacteraceae bacterium]